MLSSSRNSASLYFGCCNVHVSLFLKQRSPQRLVLLERLGIGAKQNLDFLELFVQWGQQGLGVLVFLGTGRNVARYGPRVVGTGAGEGGRPER